MITSDVQVSDAVVGPKSAADFRLSTAAAILSANTVPSVTAVN